MGVAWGSPADFKKPEFFIFRREVNLLERKQIKAGHLNVVSQRIHSLPARGSRLAGEMLDIPTGNLEKAHGGEVLSFEFC